MTRAVQTRIALAGLASIGRPALLAGSDCGHAYVEQDADMAPGNYDTAADNHVVTATVVSIASSYGSRTGQIVEVMDVAGGPVVERYRLDRLLRDSGIIRKHIAVIQPL